MIWKDENGKYRVKFQHDGRTIQKRTKLTAAGEARKVEARLRSELELGNYGILKPSPTLEDFLKNDFLRFNKVHLAAKPKSAEYYEYGTQLLLKAWMGKLRLHEITNQHANGFMAHYPNLSPSTINCGLRTLRRALNLAEEWGALAKSPRIHVGDKNEKRRDRVLTDKELLTYLAVCREPWKSVALLLFFTGMRPGECYGLRWQHVLLNGESGWIQVAEGKTKAARRLLPIVPEVHTMLKERWEAQGKPSEGWVFPSGSSVGHFTQYSAKNQHIAAIHAIRAAGIKSFPPYVLRHSALTRLAEAGADAFTLAKIAGHSGITMTSRYVHPEQEAVARVFENRQKLTGVVAAGGCGLKKQLPK